MDVERKKVKINIHSQTSPAPMPLLAPPHTHQTPSPSREENSAPISRTIRSVIWALRAMLVVLLLLLIRAATPGSHLHWHSRLLLASTHLLAINLGLCALRMPSRLSDAWGSHSLKIGLGLWAGLWGVALLFMEWIHFASPGTDCQQAAQLTFAAGTGLICVSLSHHRVLTPWVTKSAATIVSILFVLLAAELVLRFTTILPARVRYYMTEQRLQYRKRYTNTKVGDCCTSMFTPDPDLAFRYKPNFTCKIPSPFAEVAGYTHKTNSAGFLGQDYPPNTPVDVAVIGDSFVAGTWPGILQHNTGWHVLNLGVPGYGPPQYNIVLRKHALPRRPRIILYCLFLNDASDATVYQKWRNSGQDWLTFRGNRWFIGKRPSYRHDYARWLLMEISRLYGLGEYLCFPVRADAPKRTRHLPHYRGPHYSLLFDDHYYHTLANTKSRDIQQGLATIAACLKEAKTLCDEAGVRLVVLLLPAKEYAHADALQSVLPRSTPLQSLEAYYASLHGACAHLGLDCSDLTEPFRKMIRKNNRAYYFRADSHWNDDGNRLAAEVVEEIVTKRGLEPRP